MHGNSEETDVEMHDGVPEKEVKANPVDVSLSI